MDRLAALDRRLVEQRGAAAREGREQTIIGAMIESNLHEGAQKLDDPAKLRYGVSVTDECIGWDTTERLLLEGYERLA